MTLLAIIADDLTGAADAAAPFASQGFSTTISFGDALSDSDVLACSTESRDRDRQTAARESRRAAHRISARCAPPGPRWIYTKIDSALRGHPREELLAVMSARGAAKALVAAALPAETRTTIGGRQYIAGMPLETSDLASPGATSDLTALFDLPAGTVRSLNLATVREGIEAVREFLGRVTHGIVVADAEHDADLLTLAGAAINSDFCVLCGSAGFARQLAFVLPLVPSGQASGVTYHKKGPVLIIAGSQHQATAAQVEVVHQSGIPVVCLGQKHIDDPAAAVNDAVDEVAHHLAGGHSAVLTTLGLDPSVQGAEFVVACLAEFVIEPNIYRHLGGLVLTGGDVAAGVLAGIGSTVFHLRGEIRPAMPWGIVESALLPPLPVATKAGSFGTEDALQACLAYLEGLGSTSTD